ncbi:MAG: hypothetical protein HY317_05915 [Acidobacteria bacterium]|nr:hypothetical protein [Acidobacteriota bacterium]
MRGATAMFHALREGSRAVGRSWGLAVLLLAVNGSLAAVLAVPLAGALETDLEGKDAATTMMYGFDYAWWNRWSERQTGWTRTFAPDVFGTGFAFKNVDLLLKGTLPARLLEPRAPEEDDDAPPPLDPVILGLGAVYLFLQVFLTGGVLGVFRGRDGSWTVRGLLHGSGFYCGRLLRVALLTLAADWLLFRLWAPMARWADHQALESVSEDAALAWSFGRHAVLLVALLLVHLVSSYAKVIVVLEERSSAVLAMLSSAAFCLGHPLRTAGHYFSVVALGVILLAGWSVVDASWTVTGYKTQIAALALFQAFVLARIALRLALLAGQTELYRTATTEGR